MKIDIPYNFSDLSTETLKFELDIVNKIIERISYRNHPAQISFQQRELYKSGLSLADGYKLKSQVLFVFHRLKNIGVLKNYVLPHHHNLIEQFRCEPNDEELRLYKDQLEAELNKRVGILESHSEFLDDKLQKDIEQDHLDWPSDFLWKDEHIYDLAGKGEIAFMPKNKNITETYFKMMESKKGWVNVIDMSKKTGESPQQVRVKLNQIKIDKIGNKGLSKLITVQAKKDYSGGAYRLHPYPKLNV